MKKRLISILLALSLLLSTVVLCVQAAAHSGTCGEDLRWNLDTDSGILTVSGTGEMEDYSYDSPSPWNAYLDSIKAVIVEDGVTRIGNDAFTGCKNLSDISLPNSLSAIGRVAFSNCDALRSVILPDGLKTIGAGAFTACISLESIHIPDSVTVIENDAFSNDEALKSVILPKGLTRIEECTFMGCDTLVSVSIPSSVNFIGQDAFSNCYALTDVTIPEGVTTIAEGTFSFCFALPAITLPSTLTSIERAAFHSCSSLKRIVIPAKVRSIGKSAFYGCEALESVCFMGDAPAIDHTSFRWMGITPTLYYIEGNAGWTSPLWYNHPCQTWDGIHVPHTHSYENFVCTYCGAVISFRDVSDKSWYKDAVFYAVSNNLMNGIDTDIFDPEGSMTRAMLVTVLWRYVGKPQEVFSSFDDVKDGEWYTKAVLWCADNGIVNGVDDNNFDPNGKITREQMAAILYRFTKREGLDLSKTADLSSFPDGKKTSFYAQTALSWTVGEGLIAGTEVGGKVYLDPQGNATRAQVATILMRYIENVLNG